MGLGVGQYRRHHLLRAHAKGPRALLSSGSLRGPSGVLSRPWSYSFELLGFRASAKMGA